MQPDSSSTSAPLRRTALVLLLLFVVDLGVVGQGFFSLLVAMLGFGLCTAGGLLSLVRGGSPLVLRARLQRAVLYLLLGGLTLTAMQFHARTAVRHAEQVVVACREYQKQHGTLPDSLDALVPAFLPAVPSSRYTVLWGGFDYRVTDAGVHSLQYVAFPPFGRPTYDFEKKSWSNRD